MSFATMGLTTKTTKREAARRMVRDALVKPDKMTITCAELTQRRAVDTFYASLRKAIIDACGVPAAFFNPQPPEASDQQPTGE